MIVLVVSVCISEIFSNHWRKSVLINRLWYCVYKPHWTRWCYNPWSRWREPTRWGTLRTWRPRPTAAAPSEAGALAPPAGLIYHSQPVWGSGLSKWRTYSGHNPLAASKQVKYSLYTFVTSCLSTIRVCRDRFSFIKSINNNDGSLSSSLGNFSFRKFFGWSLQLYPMYMTIWLLYNLLYNTNCCPRLWPRRIMTSNNI